MRLSDHQQQDLRRRLLERRQQLEDLRATGEAAAATVTLDQTTVGRLSRMDALQDQAMSRERQRRRQQELRRIAAALDRIDSGEYGDCVRCGDDIAPARLQHDPAASLCIDCASEQERS